MAAETSSGRAGGSWRFEPSRLAEREGMGRERFAGLSGGEKTKLAIAHIWAQAGYPAPRRADEPSGLSRRRLVIGELNAVRRHDRSSSRMTGISSIRDGRSDHRTAGRRGRRSIPATIRIYREEKARRYASQLHQFEEQQKYEREDRSGDRPAQELVGEGASGSRRRRAWRKCAACKNFTAARRRAWINRSSPVFIGWRRSISKA